MTGCIWQEEKMKFTATEFWEILCDQEITQILENSWIERLIASKAVDLSNK